MAEINQIHGVLLVIVVIIILVVAVLQMKIIAQISILCVLTEKHCIWQKTKYYIIDLKLNNGNEKTFWFNLLLLIMKINKLIIFLLKQLNLIIIIEFNYSEITYSNDKYFIFFIEVLFFFIIYLNYSLFFYYYL